MALYDNHLNFGYGIVATPPTPATSGTSLKVGSGGGVRYSAGQNCTVWPTGEIPTFSTAEIVRITAISGDTLTISRQQEGTPARSILVGDQIANTETAKVFTDIENFTLNLALGSLF